MPMKPSPWPFSLAVLMLLSAGLAAAAPPPPASGEEEVYPHGSFEGDCGDCHGPDGWKPAVIGPGFDHARSGFALVGAHKSVQCAACHQRLDFSRTSSDCVSCHADIHTGELGQDCSRCHTSNSFVERADEVRSHRVTRFPLKGAHLSLDCRECHNIGATGNLVFVNTPGECRSCHLEDYLSASSPDHQTAGFSQECRQCHLETGWAGRSFNHALTGFALKGEHRTLACDECHTGGFTGAQADCIDCHQDDYNLATNPDHQSSAFPLTCGDCHSTSSWQGARFEHRRYFPIYGGAHGGEWSSCATCHTSPSNFTVFTCLSCHPHSDKNKTDGDHRGKSGYAYDSNECYSCHPNGRED